MCGPSRPLRSSPTSATKLSWPASRLFLVITLRQPVWEYGLASALSYGGGTAFSLAGGRLGDRVGHRSLALAGNSVIPQWREQAEQLGVERSRRW